MTLKKETEPSLLRLTILLFAGLICFGMAPILVRYATDTDPITLAALRCIFAVFILLPYWLRKRVSLPEMRSNGTKPILIAAAGIALGLHFSLWITSLDYTSVASASVLVTIHPVMLIVAERLIFKKNFRPLVWIGVLVAFGGSLLLGLADDTGSELFPNALTGNFLAFSAAVVFVVYFMIGRKIRQTTEWIDYVFNVYLFAAIFCVVLTIIWTGGIPLPGKMGILMGIALAAGPTIIGHGSMNYAVKYVSPTLLSTLILSEAVLAAVAAFFLFGEIPAALSIFAMILIMAGVSLSWSRRMVRKRDSS